MRKKHYLNILFVLTLLFFCCTCQAQSVKADPALDARVNRFLEDSARSWHDMNVPASDGKLLYDLIVKNGYTRALEIGTSTGHSSVWIAWALSKTGGKLITIEVDESRHKQALENFKTTGLSGYIDARLGDAHEIVKELEGPFDFVFSDADKGWYKNYFVDLEPKLAVNGCFTAHNISGSGRGNWGTGEFYEYILSLPQYETTLNRSGGGLSISYKRSEK